MRVCDTCGAFLVIGDTEKRIQSHLEARLSLFWLSHALSTFVELNLLGQAAHGI